MSSKNINEKKLQYDEFLSPPNYEISLKHAKARRVCKPIIKGNQDILISDSALNQDESIEIEMTFREKSESMIASLNGNGHRQSISQQRISRQSFSTKNGNSEQEINEKCPCCKLPIENEQIDLCCDVKNLSHLGSYYHSIQFFQVSFSLYFNYIKKCAFLLIVQLLISGVYNLLSNMQGQTCQERFVNNFICQLSLLNILNQKDQNSMQMQSVCNFITIVVLLVLIECLRVLQELERYKIENHRVTTSDFTLQISGFKNDAKVEDVEQFLKNIEPPNLEPSVKEICKIYFIFNMGDYTKLYRLKKTHHMKKNKISADIRKLNANKKQLEEVGQIERLEDINRRLEILQSESNSLDQKLVQVDQELFEFIKMLKNYKSLNDMQQNQIPSVEYYYQNKLLNFSGLVLVTFNDYKYQKLLLKKWEKTWQEKLWYSLYKNGILKQTAKSKLHRFTFDGKLIRLLKAAEPKDYIWENLGSSDKKRVRLLMSFVIFFLFCCSFYALVGLKRVIKREQHTYSNNQLLIISLSFAASTIVALTNTIVGICIRKIASIETHKKQTNFYVTVGKDLSYLFFINMVLTTLVSNMVMIDFGFTEVSQYPFNLVDLLYDFFFLFITNTYLSSIFNYFDIVWGIKKIRRWWTLKQGDLTSIAQVKNILNMLQQFEANALFEGHQVDMALRYANVQKLMLFTAAVSPYLPIGIVLSIFGCLTCYWVDKYLLLRRYVVPFYLDKRLANTMIGMLPSYTLLFSVGNLLVMCIPVLSAQSLSSFTFPDFYTTSYFYIAIFGVFMTFTYNYVGKIFFIQNLYMKLFNTYIPKKQISKHYSYYSRYFEKDYQNYHPPIKFYPCMYKEERRRKVLNQLNKYAKSEGQVIAQDLVESLRRRVNT